VWQKRWLAISLQYHNLAHTKAILFNTKAAAINLIAPIMEPCSVAVVQ
jgi:hypothetical protein